MVAYNFQKQFAPAIREGLKTHTIRRNGKRRHAEPGEQLQIYTGMRTASCQKIIDDVTCTHSLHIVIVVGKQSIYDVVIAQAGNSVEIEDLDRFATDDGFSDLQAFHDFWIGFHGVGVFQGRLISWSDFAANSYRSCAP